MYKDAVLRFSISAIACCYIGVLSELVKSMDWIRNGARKEAEQSLDCGRLPGVNVSYRVGMISGWRVLLTRY